MDEMCERYEMIGEINFSSFYDLFYLLGCYGQTELGHGSNVRKMETVAIYNPDDHLLTLHSPSITSTKLWPGGLGLVRW